MYKVVGQDQREYGPVTREAILEWIAQGRANGETIAKFEDGAWKPLRTFEEFKEALGARGEGSSGASPSQRAPSQTGAAPPVATTTVVASGPAPLPFSGVGSQQKTNVAAVIGLVAPIVCCCCPYVGPVLGVIFSLVGLSQIRANPNKYSTSEVLPKIGLGVSIFILVMHVIMSILDAQVAKYLPKMPQGF